MKHLITVLFLTAFLTACTTTPTGETIADVERIARITKEAATIGTQEALKAHPEWLPQFKLALAELTVLETADTVSVDSILDIIGRLPVQELHSDNARLAVMGARLIISSIDVPSVDAERLAQVRPIVTALKEGLIAGGVKP